MAVRLLGASFTLQARMSIVGFDHVVGKVDQELSQATLGCGIVTQDRGEGRIAKGFGKALTKRLASPGIVTETTSQLAMAR